MDILTMFWVNVYIATFYLHYFWGKHPLIRRCLRKKGNDINKLY